MATRPYQLLWINVMLDFICMGFAALWVTVCKRKIKMKISVSTGYWTSHTPLSNHSVTLQFKVGPDKNNIQIKSKLTWDVLYSADYIHIFLSILYIIQAIAAVYVMVDFICKGDLELSGTRVEREGPDFEFLSGKEFFILYNSLLTRDPDSSMSPWKWNQPWHIRSQYPI